MPPTTGRTDRAARRKLLPRVIRRDGGICYLCGQPGADSADHLVPESRGGTTTLDNLAAAHLRCNQIRGTRSIEAARADITRTNQPARGWDW
jgi:5-methylcytosine-specific restriction endonuclease McrA